MSAMMKAYMNVYELNKIPYLPHYTERHKYVGPGYGLTNTQEYTADELLALGATVKSEYLTVRWWK